MVFVDLDEIEDQLINTPFSEEVSKRLTRHRSRVSESHSETESDTVRNGSVQRQISVQSMSDISHSKLSIETTTKGPKVVKEGQQLIETEKAETGNVSWAVFKHYFRSIGYASLFITVSLNFVHQVFSVGSNAWLGIWADDNQIYVNGTLDTGKRDMYLGVYGALGFGQGK